MKFCFSDMVVVERNLIGCVVKSWCGSLKGAEPEYEVYVRMYNQIKTYKESEIERYMVRHKYLDEQELEWNYNAAGENQNGSFNADEFIESCRSDFENEEDFKQFKNAANSFAGFMKELFAQKENGQTKA